MNKRGQVYILAAIILTVMLYTLAATVNSLKQESLDDNFEKISKNYEVESTKLINNILLEEDPNVELNESFNNFTVLFTSYLKSQNPDYGTVYTLSFKDKHNNDMIQIGNYFDKQICISHGGETEELDGCFGIIPVTLTFEGLDLGTEIIQGEVGGCTTAIDYVSSVSIGIKREDLDICSSEDVIWYDLKVEKNKPQVMIVSHLDEGEQRQVFVWGEGLVSPG